MIVLHYLVGRVEAVANPTFYSVMSKSTPNAPNQEINGMNAYRRSPGMNAIWHSPCGI